MNTDIFKFLNQDDEDILQNMRFDSLEDLQNTLMPQNPLESITTNKSFREISNEIALETPLGKQSAFYKPTIITQNIRRIEDFEVKIRVMVEDDLALVREKYNKEIVSDNDIKLYVVVKDESLINKGKLDDLRSANIRLSNIEEITGVVLGNRIFTLFNDFPERMEWYINKIVKDFIGNDLQLGPLKEDLRNKFEYYMKNKRNESFPLGLIGKLIQQELKKDLKEFWKPILTSIAKDIRTLKIEDEKYWQPYTPEGKLKTSKDFTPLIGKRFVDAESNVEKFIKPFKEIDKVLQGYLDLSKIGNDNKFKNQAHNSKLKRALAQIYNLFKSILNDFKDGLFKFINKVADKIYQLNAFLVGVINGAIEFVASLFDLMGLLTGLLSGDAHILWQAIKKEFKNLKEKGAFKYLFEALGKFFADINKRYNTKQSQYLTLKNLGEDLFSIIEFVLGAFAAFKVGKTILKTAKESYDKFKKRIDDILAKRKKELDEIEEKPLGGKGPLGKGIVIGKYSNRPFNPDKAGGPILDLDWRNVKIDNDGIDIVKKHLSRFDDVTANKKMIKRLEDIKAGRIEITDWDKRFYTHELREYERYKNLGVEDGFDPGYELWNDAHTGTLEDFKLSDLDDVGNNNLYHPDIKPEDFN